MMMITKDRSHCAKRASNRETARREELYRDELVVVMVL